MVVWMLHVPTPESPTDCPRGMPIGWVDKLLSMSFDEIESATLSQRLACSGQRI